MDCGDFFAPVPPLSSRGTAGSRGILALPEHFRSDRCVDPSTRRLAQDDTHFSPQSLHGLWNFFMIFPRAFAGIADFLSTVYECFVEEKWVPSPFFCVQLLFEHLFSTVVHSFLTRCGQETPTFQLPAKNFLHNPFMDCGNFFTKYYILGSTIPSAHISGKRKNRPRFRGRFITSQ